MRLQWWLGGTGVLVLVLGVAAFYAGYPLGLLGIGLGPLLCRFAHAARHGELRRRARRTHTP